jgi:hypothetical protein
MAHRLEKWAHLLGRVNARMAPPPLRRLDHWLLTHRPLVWRTRLHWIAWWSLLASAGAVMLGAWIQGQCATAWTAESLLTAILWLQIVTITVGVCWAALQLRQPVGELPGKRRASLLVLNAAAILLLLLPGFLFTLTVTYRIANSISDDEFKTELAFHKDFGFWACSGWLTQSIVDENWPRLEPSLARFGQESNKLIDSSGCDGGGHRLLRADEDHVTPLEKRLISIESSKGLWRRGEGKYAGLLEQRLRMAPILALCAAMILSLLSRPFYTWRRLMFQLSVPGLPFTPRRHHSGPLGRFGHWLLLRHPLFWATQAHVLLVGGLAVFVAIGVVWTLLAPLSGATYIWGFAVVLSKLFAALWPFAWLLVRRNHRAEASPGAARRVVGSFFLAVFPVEMVGLIATFAYSSADSLNDAGEYFAISTPFAVGVAAVRMYRSRLSTFVVAMAGLAVLIIVVATSSVLTGGAVASFFILVVLWLIAWLQIPPRAVSRRLLSPLIMIAPVMLMTDLLAARALESRDLLQAAPIVPWLIAPAVCATLAVFVGIAPLLGVLAKAELQPKPE